MEETEFTNTTTMQRALSPVSGHPYTSEGAMAPSISASNATRHMRRRRSAMQSRQLSFATLEKELWAPARIRLAALLESHTYEIILLSIVVANAIIIILEVNAAAGGDSTSELMVIGRIFLCFYTVEVLAKLFVYRLDFFSTSWNVLDLTVVVLDVSGLIVEAILDGEQVPSLSVLRVLRLGRLARLLRIMNDVKELQMLVHSFISTLRTLFWAALMLIVLLTIWSIIAVELVHPVNERLADRGAFGQDCDRCARAFRSVWDANLTFMQTIIAGDSWGVLAVPIIEESPWTSLVLVTAFISINLGVLNLVLTVIVNAAQEARESDEALQARQHEKNIESHKDRLMQLLRTVDEDKSGHISSDEMHRAVNVVPEFRTVLEAIDIRKDEVQKFFDYLASDDASGQVTYRDFVDQVFKMKSGDTVSLIMGLKNTLSKLQVSVREVKQDLERLRLEGSPVGKAQFCPPQTIEARPVVPPTSLSDEEDEYHEVIDLDEFVPAALPNGIFPSTRSKPRAQDKGFTEPGLEMRGNATRYSSEVYRLRASDALQRLHKEVDELYDRLHAELVDTLGLSNGSAVSTDGRHSVRKQGLKPTAAGQGDWADGCDVLQLPLMPRRSDVGSAPKQQRTDNQILLTELSV